MPRRLLLLLTVVLMVAACGDSDDVGSGAGSTDPAGGAGGGDPAATFVGTITEVTPLEPVTEDCIPAEELDPDGSVSSDDPPVCTDPATAPLGSILVETEPGVEGGEKIVFTILQETVLTSEGAAISFDDLAVGGEVTVGFSGQVAESYPGQATAESVDVVPPA